MKGLYTASETRKILGGISGESLKRLVDDEKIRKVLPPGNRKRGQYIKEDVDRLAAIMKEFIEIYSEDNSKGYEFRQAKDDEEIEDTVQIAKQRFGERATGLNARLDRFHKSPKGDYVLKHNSITVGFFSFQAIKPETAEELFKKKTGRWITKEDIEEIIAEKPLDILVSNIASKIGGEKRLEIEYGKKLIMNIMELLVNLGKDGINVKRVWAMSSTVSGIKLCRDILKFQNLGYINSEQLGFMLDMEKSDTPIAEQYREALKQHSQVKYNEV